MTLALAEVVRSISNVTGRIFNLVLLRYHYGRGAEKRPFFCGYTVVSKPLCWGIGDDRSGLVGQTVPAGGRWGKRRSSTNE